MIHVDLRYADFPEDLLPEIVTYIPKVEELYLPYARSINTVLQRICQCCSNICVLHLSSSFVRGHELRGLVGRDDKGVLINTKLTKLFIPAAEDSESDLIFLLTHCPNLQILDHNLVVDSLCSMQNSFAETSQDVILKYTTKLELLRLSSLKSYDRSDIIEHTAAMCPSVKSIIIPHLSQSSILALIEFDHLQRAELHTSGDIDYSPFITARGCSLTHLKLRNGSVSVKALWHAKLELLTLCNVKFTNSGYVPLSSAGVAFSNMTDVTFKEFDFSQADTLEAVKFIFLNCPNLERLSFSDCYSFTNNFLNFLLECVNVKNARELNFYGIVLDHLATQRILNSRNKFTVVRIDRNVFLVSRCELLGNSVE